jgi:hypothetical protein
MKTFLIPTMKMPNPYDLPPAGCTGCGQRFVGAEVKVEAGIKASMGIGAGEHNNATYQELYGDVGDVPRPEKITLKAKIFAKIEGLLKSGGANVKVEKGAEQNIYDTSFRPFQGLQEHYLEQHDQIEQGFH